MIPSCVDPEAQPLREHADSDVVTIGWIGSHTTVGYLRPVLPVLARLGDHGQRTKLVVIGGDTGCGRTGSSTDPGRAPARPPILLTWTSASCPCPIPRWARGKSGYKLLQYFAAGVPAVASPVGINAELVADGRGFTATSEAEWTQSLLALVPEQRRTPGTGSAGSFLCGGELLVSALGAGVGGAPAFTGELSWTRPVQGCLTVRCRHRCASRSWCRHSAARTRCGAH